MEKEPEKCDSVILSLISFILGRCTFLRDLVRLSIEISKGGEADEGFR